MSKNTTGTTLETIANEITKGDYYIVRVECRVTYPSTLIGAGECQDVVTAFASDTSVSASATLEAKRLEFETPGFLNAEMIMKGGSFAKQMRHRSLGISLNCKVTVNVRRNPTDKVRILALTSEVLKTMWELPMLIKRRAADQQAYIHRFFD